MSKFDILLPRNQNSTQRIGFSVGLISMVLIVFLHNPLDGYKFEVRHDRIEEHLKSECSQKDLDEMTNLSIQAGTPPSQWREFLANPVPLPNDWDKWDGIKRTEWMISLDQKAGAISDRCLDKQTIIEYETRPFAEWSTINPLVWWLGSLVHLLSALTTAAVATAIWLYVFQRRADNTL